MRPALSPLAAWRPSGAHFEDEVDVRALAADFFKAHEGLRSSGKTEAEYETLLFPFDTPNFRHVYADHAWSCALRMLAAWRELGVKHPLLAVPYEPRIGKAVSDVETVARDFGALYLSAKANRYEPSPGDAMISGPEENLHVSCIVDVTDDILAAVDGGQGVKGSIAIEGNLYRLARGTSLSSVRSIEPPKYSTTKPGPAKRVRSFVDLWAVIVNSGTLADRSTGA